MGLIIKMSEFLVIRKKINKLFYLILLFRVRGLGLIKKNLTYLMTLIFIM